MFEVAPLHLPVADDDMVDRIYDGQIRDNDEDLDEPRERRLSATAHC